MYKRKKKIDKGVKIKWERFQSYEEKVTIL